MNIICPKSIPGCKTYPGIPAEADFPITNISSEAPDQLIFTSPVWPRYVPPYDTTIGPDPTFWSQDCVGFVHSAISQDLADLEAYLASLILCPPNSEEKLQFSNDEQIAFASCPGGFNFFWYRVPAGTFVSPLLSQQDGMIWKEQANAQALAFAQQQASKKDLQFCIDCPILHGQGGWLCIGEEFDPDLNFFQLTGANSQADYDFTVSTGQLPPGASLEKVQHNQAALAGTATQPGNYTFKIRAQRIGFPNTFAEVQLTIMVLDIVENTIPNVVNCNTCTTQLHGAGGVSPYTFDVSSGSLPTGLSLSTSGLFSGFAKDVGTYHFTVRITDSENRTCTKSFTMVVTDANPWNLMGWTSSAIRDSGITAISKGFVAGFAKGDGGGVGQAQANGGIASFVNGTILHCVLKITWSGALAPAANSIVDVQMNDGGTLTTLYHGGTSPILGGGPGTYAILFDIAPSLPRAFGMVIIVSAAAPTGDAGFSLQFEMSC